MGRTEIRLGVAYDSAAKNLSGRFQTHTHRHTQNRPPPLCLKGLVLQLNAHFKKNKRLPLSIVRCLRDSVVVVSGYKITSNSFHRLMAQSCSAITLSNRSRYFFKDSKKFWSLELVLFHFRLEAV